MTSTKIPIPTSSVLLQPSGINDSPRAIQNTHDHHPEDILFDSLQTLYHHQPVTFTIPGASFTYTHRSSTTTGTPIEITLQTPDTHAANWSLHASSIWIASVQLAQGVDSLRIGDHVKRMVSSTERAGVETQRRLKILELGASAGLPSIIIAKLYPDISVVATDYPDPQLIQTLADNIKRNAADSNCCAAPYAWGDDPISLFHLDSTHCAQSRFDMIIAADTLWNPDSHSIFIDTLQLALHKCPHARVHLVAGLHTGRYTIQSFLRSVVQAGFCVIDVMEREVLGDETRGVVKARTRPWDVSRAELEQEEDRRGWVVWIELCWNVSQLTRCDS